MTGDAIHPKMVPLEQILITIATKHQLGLELTIKDMNHQQKPNIQQNITVQHPAIIKILERPKDMRNSKHLSPICTVIDALNRTQTNTITIREKKLTS